MCRYDIIYYVILAQLVETINVEIDVLIKIRTFI